MTELTTERLRLRPARADDLADMHAILSHPVAMTWWSTPPHETIDQTEAWLTGMIEANNPLDLIIERNGQCIGKAGFWRPPEIGYILHPDHWRQGLAHEALAAVITALFGTTDHSQVLADVDPDNLGSLRLLEKLHFQRTGFRARSWNVGGVWKDSVDLTLARSAWASTGQQAGHLAKRATD